MDAGVAFSRNPLFTVIHEACYADGCVTRWSAERRLPEKLNDQALFTGEHVYRWMFEDYAELRPMRETADLIAHHRWPRLYDEARLATGT